MTTRIRVGLLTMVTVTVCLLPSATRGQEVGSVFGDRITPLPPVSIPVALTAEEPKPVWFLAPTILGVEGANVAELGVGVLLPTAGERPFRLDLAYSRIDPDDFDSVDRFAFGARYPLSTGDRFALDALGRHSEGDEVAARTELGLRAEWELVDRLALSAVAKAVRADRPGNDEEDLVLKPGVAFAVREGLGIGADYTFDNDVDGDDGYSAAISWQSLPSLNLTLFAGSDELIGLAGFLTF